MPSTQKTILVVDDDAGHRRALATLLADWGYDAVPAADGETAVAMAQKRRFAMILMDVRMPGMSGIDAMRAIRSGDPSAPVLVMTAYSDVDTAVGALKAGAYDYLTKPLDFEELRLTLDRALDHAVLRDENHALRTALTNARGPGEMLGSSPALREAVAMIDAVAPAEATVLVTGASGTGKELAARMIHARSARSAGPFVAVNCAALSESLLESELFGHEKGAFTGADKMREGRFRAADGGTVFLDEVGEIPLAMQPKLLRAIQEREVQRVGGDRPEKVDVRIVAATNRDLAAEAAAGRYREDLYYRLNVVNVRLPSLAERPEDVPVLAAHFLRLFAEKNGKLVKGFAPAAMARLQRHSWPGNVRELENTVERAVVLVMGEYVTERELPPGLGMPEPGAEPAAASHGFSGKTLEEIERDAVRAALEEAGGNKSEAARRLGITRKTLLAKLRG